MATLFEIEGIKQKRAKNQNLINKTKKKASSSTSNKSNSNSVRSMTMIDLINEIQKSVSEKLGKYEKDYRIINDFDEYLEFIKLCNQNEYVAIDTETTGLNPLTDKIVGASFYTPGEKAVYVPINHVDFRTEERLPNQLREEQVREGLEKLTANIIMFNADFDIRVFRHQVGVHLTCYWDCYIAMRLMNENEPSNKLKVLHEKYVLKHAEKAFTFDQLFDPKRITFNYIPIESAYIYAAHDAIITYEFYEYQRQYLNPDGKKGLDKVFDLFMQIEMPCVNVVCDMEDQGFKLDLEYSKSLGKKYNEIAKEALNECYAELDKIKDKIDAYRAFCAEHEIPCKLDDPVNLNSSNQLRIVLYDILHVGVVDKKNPRGTGENILKQLDIPLTRAILNHRKVSKLLSTYIEKLPKVLLDDGKVHCKFNQMGAETGRFCIAEGTKISIVGGHKNIENITPGDRVYCYDKNNRLQISDVVNKWKTGTNVFCLRLTYINTVLNKKSDLICTPEHKLLSVNRGWVAAKDIRRKDRIIFLTRDRDGIIHSSDGVELPEEEFIPNSSKEPPVINAFEIYSVGPYGDSNVYDIEVKGYHNFIANDLCVHNSSDSPNLQNIPSKNKEIRKMFVADDGCVLMSSDYSQQEPKLMAQLSNDERLIQTFVEGKDIYAEIAAVSFHKTYEECLEHFPKNTPITEKNGKWYYATPEEIRDKTFTKLANGTTDTYDEGCHRRKQAKTILLGILYGRGEKSIAEQLNCDTKEARAIKQSVFTGFPSIEKFESDSLKMAKSTGYVTTLWGRKRRLPDINLPLYEFAWASEEKANLKIPIPKNLCKKWWDKISVAKWWDKAKIKEQAEKIDGIKIIDNGGKIAEAERQTVNSRIQGSAADMTKKALIALNRNEELRDLGMKIIVPIHDEIIIQCPEENAAKVKELFAHTMETCAQDKLTIPIKCDVEVTKEWYGDALDI